MIRCGSSVELIAPAAAAPRSATVAVNATVRPHDVARSASPSSRWLCLSTRKLSGAVTRWKPWSRKRLAMPRDARPVKMAGPSMTGVEGGGGRVGASARADRTARAGPVPGRRPRGPGRRATARRRSPPPPATGRPGRPCTCVGAPTTTRSTPAIRSAVVVAADTTSVANTLPSAHRPRGRRSHGCCRTWTRR